MTDEIRPAYCGKCGNPANEEDKFCGTCGTVVLSPPQQAEQVVPKETAAAQGVASTPRRRRRAVWTVGLCALAVLLVGSGALATAFSDRLGLLSGAESGISTVPDPAFDELLPVLGQTTSAPVMLPAELPSGLENVAVDADLEGEEYGILFLYDPPENVVEGFSGAGTIGTLEVSPEPESLSNEYFEATSVDTFELLEGTEATLRYMEPVTIGGTDGPYWEGKFDRQGYTYTLIVTNPEEISEEGARRVLSTMVEVPDLNTGIADGLGATESVGLAARVTKGEAYDD